MKNIILKTIIIALAIFTATQVSAQDRKDLINQLRSDIQNYKNINIKPQMDNWKSDIEKNIKSEDLIKLNELRKKAAEMKAEQKAKFEQFRKDNENKPSKRMKKDGNREIMKDEMQEIGKDLKTIVQNNKEYFENLFDDAKPILRKWRDEIEDIVEEWHESNEDALENAKQENGEFHKGFHHKMNNMIGGKKQAVARILLYNGQDDFMDEPLLKNNMDTKGFNEKSSNYPNPFTEQTVIKFNLPESGTVKISIIDEFGKEIEQIQNYFLNKGEHTINYTPKTKLNNGLYFYRIESETYKESGKLFYQK